MISNTTIQYQNNQVHLTRFGDGEKLLIALHGFADRGASFSRLTNLGVTYRVLAIDLPFHGKTIWEAPTFTPFDIEQIIHLILKQEKVERFSLMGHSLGARIAIGMAMRFETQLDKLFLLAPDGLRSKYIFNMNLVPIFIRKLLAKRLQKNPNRVLKLADFLKKWNWLPPYAHQFVHLHLGVPHRRKRLFGVWLSLWKFITFPARIKRHFFKAPYEIYLLFGQKDPIISPLISVKYYEKRQHIHVHYIDTGHPLIGEEWNTFFMFLIYDDLH